MGRQHAAARIFVSEQPTIDAKVVRLGEGILNSTRQRATAAVQEGAANEYPLTGAIVKAKRTSRPHDLCTSSVSSVSLLLHVTDAPF